ncbi:NAD-dependent epimerase/dehydratase family protein [Lentzea sp. NPDC005914]|uniref:NAD-dependent epimerase/dehydratase family protein n=1 Tax=Lentzea sp. NPDC005914 TaxID=3154572 RepID=UPI0033F5BE24
MSRLTGGESLVAQRITVLVTGGHGFIGSHLAFGLALRRFRVVVADRIRRETERVESVQLDVTDFGRCVEVVRTVRPDVVFHLAASSTIDSAFADPRDSLMTNVCGTMNVLEAVRTTDLGLRRFVLASTDKVYGELTTDSYREDSALHARGVYDVGKLSADQLTRMYGDELGVPVSVLRLCNVFGPGDPHTGSRIVPRSLSRMFDPVRPLPPVLYEPSIAHGRDYVYVTDVVRALELVAFSPAACGEVFNMVPTAHRTTLDLVEEMMEKAERACEPHDPDRAAAIRKNGYEVVSGNGSARALARQHCDGTKLGSLLGFRNLVSMSEGLDRTVMAFMQDCGIG